MNLFSKKKTNSINNTPDLKPTHEGSVTNGNTKADLNVQNQKTPGSSVDPQQDGSSGEFAQKPSSLSNPLITRSIKAIVIVFVVILVTVVAFAIYQAVKIYLNRPPEIVPEDPRKPEPETVVKESINAKYAYIKDNESIWINAIDGDSNTKKRIFEVDSKTELLTTIQWKNQNKDITYAKCLKSSSSCEISSLNIAANSITPEVSDINSNYIKKFAWSDDLEYIAYIAQIKNPPKLKDIPYVSEFRLKSGAVDLSLEEVPTIADQTNTLSKVFITPGNRYLVYSTMLLELVEDKRGSKEYTEVLTPIIKVYKMNGSLVEDILGGSDPFLKAEEQIGYQKNGILYYKRIGQTDEIKITDFPESYNPALSFDSTRIAFWKKEGGFNDLIIGVYESGTNIQRNILRGFGLPMWIDDNSVLGIKPDGCLGENCQLYEYQTFALSVIDINNSAVKIIDQGKIISETTLKDHNYKESGN